MSAPEIPSRAQDHLRCLIYGLDPRTQQPVVDVGALADPEVLRSLVFALEVLDQRSESLFSEKKHGGRAGARWNRAEDAKLLAGFQAGAKLDELVSTHGRGEGGILSRLEKLNAVPSRREGRTIFSQRERAEGGDGVV